uniref:H15 domain-containing protein n=1 Tax=Leptobrachium leishanense TaxID=445787 RepID=A0A8C5Q0V4_9ANUR
MANLAPRERFVHDPAITTKKKQPKKAAGARKSSKASCPSVSELIVKAVSASKERSGVSLPALKKVLSGCGYDVEKNNSRLKLALKALVTKETLVQVKGSGASGSFKLNKQTGGKAKTATPKKAPAKVKKPAPKKVAKSPAKAKKPSPKKVKAAKPKKVAKSPAKKASKPKAVKSPAKGKKAATKKR